jgi:hypothetical protein
MHRPALLPVITITAAACLALTACGNNEKEVSFKSAGVTHRFSEGEETKTANFPLPIFPNASPIGAKQIEGDQNDHENFMVLSSTAKLNEVSEFYTKKLKEDGWTLNANTNMPQMVNISASKKDLEANVMLGTDADKTTITLAVSKEPEGVPKVTDENYTPDKLNPPTD